jgi:gluconate 5-dehydrogenase
MRARGFRVEGLVADVSRPPDVQAVVDGAVTAFGEIDILINNAGVTWGENPEAMPLEKWQKVIDRFASFGERVAALAREAGLRAREQA